MSVTYQRTRNWQATIADAAALAERPDPNHAAGWLLLAALEADPPVEDEDPRDWPLLLARLARQPWTTEIDPLTADVLRTADEGVRRAVAEFRRACQQREADRERATIAGEVRRIVAVSGLTQREFAARVGTSASRLSSYVHGHVVPSAAMMLRIKRLERLHSLPGPRALGS